ncbi:MAG: hypothetical protein AABY64_08910 [Bdellovibrionota bacterium]
MNHLIKTSLKLVIAISAVVAISSQGWARSSGGDGVLLSLNPFYQTISDDGGGATTTSYTETKMDVNLGYQMATGLYLGALYFTDTTTTSPVSSGAATSGSGYGVSVGYLKNGWFGHLHYILSADKDDNTADADKWSKGTGIQADVGYMMAVSGPFMLGVELAYRSLSYTTNTVAAVDSTAFTRKASEVTPKIRLTFIF